MSVNDEHFKNPSATYSLSMQNKVIFVLYREICTEKRGKKTTGRHSGMCMQSLSGRDTDGCKPGKSDVNGYKSIFFK